MMNASPYHNSHGWFHHFPHRYQEKKACGKIVQISVKSVSPATRKKLQEKWKASKRRCRARAKVTQAVLDLTPQSPDQDHEEINEVPVARPAPVAGPVLQEDIHEAPVAGSVLCSTPTQLPKEMSTRDQSTPKRVRKRYSVQKQLRKLNAK